MKTQPTNVGVGAHLRGIVERHPATTQPRCRVTIAESADVAGDRVVRGDDGSIKITGVKLVGLQSRNGRRYTERALRGAAGLYEGVHVFVNHHVGPRGYEERLGGISNVHYVEGQGLFGDLDVNPKHPMAEAVAHDALNGTRGVGLSHSILCESRRSGGETVIERIEKVQSVDLVTGPATTDSLFEQLDNVAAHERHGATIESRHEGKPQMSLHERLSKIANGPRLAHSIHEMEAMGDLPPADVDGDGDVDAADRELIALLKDKVRKSDAFTDDEKQLLLQQLDSGDPEKVEQVEERYESSIFVPTPASKYKQLSRR